MSKIIFAITSCSENWVIEEDKEKKENTLEAVLIYARKTSSWGERTEFQSNTNPLEYSDRWR